MKLHYPSQTLFGISFFDGKREQVVHLLEQWLGKKKGLLTVATPNPEQIVLAQQSGIFATELREFDLYLPDGQGIVWASNILGKPLAERIAGVEVVEELLRVAAEKVLRFTIVGGRNYEQISNSKNIQWIEGYRDIGVMSEEEKAKADTKVSERIKDFQPSIVFVALGAPEQEAWVMRNRAELEKANVRIAMVVGGAFDFILGKVSRAPEFIQSSGLEWLFRLIQEPWRWRRQLRLVSFVRKVLIKKVLGFE